MLGEVHHFARDAAGRLFLYQDGVYRPGAEFFLRQQVKRLLLLFNKPERWSSGLARELIEYILLDAPELETRALAGRDQSARTGCSTSGPGQLSPHTPRLLSDDPQSRSAMIRRRAVSGLTSLSGRSFPRTPSCSPGRCSVTCSRPDRSIQKAIALIGEGGNGKGVFLQLAVNFVGPENVSHLSLQKLETDRFAPARLYGKLANICSDLPSERMAGSAVFKAITGCDRITGEFKYRDSFEFTPFARLLISANHLPSSRDASKAFFDRWLIIPFNAGFRNTRREIPRSVLDAALSTSIELSGALNEALPALRRIRRAGKFSESPLHADKPKNINTRPIRCRNGWPERRSVPRPSRSPQDRLHAA